MGRHAMFFGDHANDVLVVQQIVGHFGERAEAHIDLTLAGGAYLVMVNFDFHSQLLESQHDLRSDVLQLV